MARYPIDLILNIICDDDEEYFGDCLPGSYRYISKEMYKENVYYETEHFVRDLMEHLSAYPEHSNIACIAFNVGHYAKRLLDVQDSCKYDICYAIGDEFIINDQELFDRVKDKVGIKDAYDGVLIYKETNVQNYSRIYELASCEEFCHGFIHECLISAEFVELDNGQFMLYLDFDTCSG